MPELLVQFKGLDELRRAIARNPAAIIREAQWFLQRAMAVYRGGIRNNPWRVGGAGGGVPQATGHLKDSHAVRIQQLSASIGPGRNYPVPYAPWVHEGTRNMQGRPWLDYVKQAGEKEIQTMYRDFFAKVVHQLAT